MGTLQNISPEIIRALSESVQAHFKNIEKALEPLKEDFHRDYQALQDVPESIKTLAEYGWYLPFDFHPPEVNHFADELKNGNSGIVNDKMIDLFDSSIGDIKAEIVSKFPDRRAPIEAALSAHLNQEYYLSIPVFLAQSDGICKSIMDNKYSLFGVKKAENYPPWTSFWVQEHIEVGSIYDMVLGPLKINGGFNKHESEFNPLGFSRHDVLHGSSVDYDENKTNSYKALSLLNYVGETVYMAKQYINEKRK